MPFIGNQPATSFEAVKKDRFTGLTGTSVTLSHSVSTVQDIVLWINAVKQDYTSYSVNGTALTVGGSLVSSDIVEVAYLGRTFQTVNPSAGSVGTSQLVDGSITSAKLASGVGGVDGISSSANATAISIDSSEVVRLPVGILRLQNATTGTADTDGLLIEASGNDVYINNKENAGMYFRTNNTDRLVINSGGTVLVGTTDTSLYNNTSGSGWFADILGSQQTASASRACADWNRMGNDGNILGIYQAGNNEGSISVSGSTVSYNGFTGTHWSRFQDNSTPTILKGTVLETLDEMCDWYNLEFDITDEEGNINTKKIPHVLLDGQSDGDVITYNHEGTDYQATIVKEVDVKHMMSKVSDTTDAKNVYGVFIAYDLDGEGYNDFYVASVGSFVVRIKSGQTLAKGDLLQSNGDGTAKVQTDDNIKSSSFAKVLSTTVIETYDDGSFIVPCSLMC